ncbi:mycothione reductase [Hoyosella sp. G463]|uniref:Mycothione reductase n=1 Tax=Lolliginicoccus lacisalsi TaxID=2742202 RepID=A0A927JDQ7_9ACTN|nr:mycothione reductase [Lolliginicoccus lacisalsi]MBD8506762.1 mycothione reductase [Lolliginicoccus lacisalsi]
MQHFDLAIIGTGSGNSIIDERFSSKRIAVIERGSFGGTCLNAGCIPTKMLVHTADLAHAARHGARFGLGTTVEEVDWTAIQERVFGRIDPIEASGREYRSGHADNSNVTVFAGTARFTGAKELGIEPNGGGRATTITADEIVIAAGSRPTIPGIAGLDEIDYHTSDTIMRVPELPKRLAIIGGGFVAAEFAHVFSALGVEVTLIARSSTLLRGEDADIAERFTDIASARWDTRLARKTVRAEALDRGTRLTLEGPAGEELLDTDAVLIAVGRTPNTDLLDVPAAGIRTTSDGRIAVDEHQRTSIDGIWALGDISSPWGLKHVANHEQRVVQHNLLNPNDLAVTDHRFVPHAVFSAPQIASVGLTEAGAHAAGIDIDVAVQDYADVAYGWAMEDKDGFVKLIADRATGQLVGAHILGAQAATLIQPLIQAMSLGFEARSLARGQYWIHPALPEAVENALLKLPARR